MITGIRPRQQWVIGGAEELLDIVSGFDVLQGGSRLGTLASVPGPVGCDMVAATPPGAPAGPGVAAVEGSA